MPKVIKEDDDYIEQLGDISIDDYMEYLKKKWPYPEELDKNAQDNS